jgi:hypothetical protein
MPRLTTQLSAATYPDGNHQRIYVFVGGEDKNLYIHFWDGNQWAWANQGNPGAGITIGPTGPTVLTYQDRNGVQRIYSFTPVGNLYAYFWDGNQWTWANQGNPGEVIAYSKVAAITYQDGNGMQRIYAFVNPDQGVHFYVNFFDGSRWAWADQNNQGGAIWDQAAVTYLDNQGAQRIYVFCSLGTTDLAINFWDGNKWAWTYPGDPGQPVVSPEAITYLDNQGAQRIYVFTVGANDGHLYIYFWDGNQWAWADQGTPPGGQRVVSPEAITYLDNQGAQRIYVFTVGANDGHLYIYFWDGNRWAWADQGTPPGGQRVVSPEAITYLDNQGAQRIYVFTVGANDGHLYIYFWDGNQWAWADQDTPP